MKKITVRKAGTVRLTASLYFSLRCPISVA